MAVRGSLSEVVDQPAVGGEKFREDGGTDDVLLLAVFDEPLSIVDKISIAVDHDIGSGEIGP